MPAGGSLDRAPRWRLPAIVALALVCRTISWLRNGAMMNDGPTFLELAQTYRAGEWVEALRHAFHPLYPMAIAGARSFFADWENAAAAVSILFGAIAVVALHAFVRSAFGGTTAWVAALLLAVHPYAVPFSGDVQSEGPYMAAFLGAVALGWRALVSRRPGDAILAGALAGLAYLVRPEGLGVVGVVGAMVGVGVLRRDWPIARAVGFGAALALGVALVAGPYIAWVSYDVGSPTLTRKKSASAMIRLETQPTGHYEPSRETLATDAQGRRVEGGARGRTLIATERSSRSPAQKAGELIETIKHAFRLDQLILVLLGLFVARGSPGPRGWYVGSLTLLYGFVLIALVASAGYVSMRHVLPPMLPLLAYAALGVAAVGRGLAAIPSLLGGRPLTARAGFALALSLVVLAGAIMATRPRRENRVAVRAVAEWFATQPMKPDQVSAAKLRDAYYAGAGWQPLPAETEDLRWMLPLRAGGIRYVIVDERHARRYPGLEEQGSPSARLLHRHEANGRWAGVYELQDPAAPGRRGEPGEGR